MELPVSYTPPFGFFGTSSQKQRAGKVMPARGLDGNQWVGGRENIKQKGSTLVVSFNLEFLSPRSGTPIKKKKTKKSENPAGVSRRSAKESPPNYAVRRGKKKSLNFSKTAGVLSPF